VTRRRAQTRERLLDAAFAVFAEQGYGGTSIEEVCDRAGYTRGAFYSNFDSLEELFFALYQQRATEVADRVTAALDGLPTDLPRDRLVAALADCLADALLGDREWMIVKTDFLLHAARNPAAAQAMAVHQAATRAALRPAIAAVLDPSALPAPLNEVDTLTRSVAAIYEAALMGLLVDHEADDARAWLRAMFTAIVGSGQAAAAASMPPHDPTLSR
jgi:AcrR family transcriptional regulator